MKSNAHHNNTNRSGFANAWQRTFGVAPSVPRANSWVITSFALVSLLGTGVAMAAWEVNDRQTQREIQDVQSRIGKDGTVTGRLTDIRNRIGDTDTVTKQLDNINRKLRIAKQNGSTPEMIAEPTGDEALNATNPSSQVVQIDQLCTAGATTMLGQQQQQLCQELVRTELAQYRFSLRMFERASKNYDRLKQIEDRRRNLTADDYANVQYNTNELLALTALMDNDRDRYRTYMAAYQARIAHINNNRTALTRNALKGSGSLSVPSI